MTVASRSVSPSPRRPRRGPAPLALLLASLLLAAPSGSARADDEPGRPGGAAPAGNQELRQAASSAARALVLRAQGRIREALPLVELALATYERAWGAQDRRLLPTLLLLGGIQRELGRLVEARATLERALAVSEPVLGPDHPDVLIVLGNQAEVLRAQGAFAAARRVSVRVLEARERAARGDSVLLATGLLNHAMLLQDLGEFAAARALVERAHGQYERVLGPEHARTAACLSNLATLVGQMGDLGGARRLHERVLEMRRKVLGPQHPEVAVSLHNLSEVLRDLGELAAARQRCDEALAIRRAVYGPRHPDVANALAGRANLLLTEGRFAAARGELEEVLAMARETLGPDHPSTAVYLANLGYCFQELGAYGRAAETYEQAQAIRERAQGPGHPDVAVVLANRATLLDIQGSLREARVLYERACALQEAALGPTHPLLAASLSSLGVCLTSLDEFDEAERVLARARAIVEATPDADRSLLGVLLNNIAGVRRRRGDLEAARALGEQAWRSSEAALGPDHPEVATLLASQASLLARMGRPEQALPLAERALAVREAAFGGEHPEVATSLRLCAVVRFALRQPEQAETLLARAMGVADRHLRAQLGSLGGARRRAALGELRQMVDDWLVLAPYVRRTGYAEVLRFKGLAARAEAADRAATRRVGAPDRELLEHLEGAERRLARLANDIPPAAQAEARGAWQERYAAAAAERERLAREMSQRAAPWRAVTESLGVDLAAVQARLPADAALVDFLRTALGYVAFVVRAEGAPVRVELGPSEPLEAACQAFVTAVVRETPELAAAGAALSALVWQPVAARWGEGVRRVVLCPDAALAGVPFGALPSVATGRPLLDDLGLSCLMCAQDLVPPGGPAAAGAGALLVGAVDYGRADAAATAAAPLPAWEAVATRERAPGTQTFAALAETRGEIEALARLLPGPTTATLLGADATEAGVRALARGRRLVHVATHGFVQEDLLRGLQRRHGGAGALSPDEERQLAAGHDPMLLAGLALAGANARDGAHGDDGILTALEASQLDLEGVELVTLSACETARGTVESGEGVLGLVQGFQLAGARSVLASLWRVDDEGTRRLMEGVYERLLRADGPLPPAEALRQAALALREEQDAAGRRRFAAPRHWAAFVAYGG